jgi:hypothetical protein
MVFVAAEGSQCKPNAPRFGSDSVCQSQLLMWHRHSSCLCTYAKASHKQTESLPTLSLIWKKPQIQLFFSY